MAKKTGRVSTTDVNDGGGYSAVGNVIDDSYNFTVNGIDATDKDSSGYEEEEYGHGQITLTLNVRYNEADNGQEAIRDAIEGKTTLTVRHRPHGTDSSARERIFTARVFDETGEHTLRGMADTTYVFRSSGSPTFQTQ